MQSKGWIRFVAICLAIASIWQLSFTVVTRIEEKKAARYAQEQRQLYLESHKDAPEYELDAVADKSNAAYIDAINNKNVYLGYTFKSVKEKEINLGLDLKGGMNIMLQVQLEDMVKALAGNNQTDPDFEATFKEASDNREKSGKDFIDRFGDAWSKVTKRELAEIYATSDSKVKANFKKEQVLEYLHEEAESAVDNSFNVLRNRIDRFGVTQPNIQKVGNSGKILIELPGVKDPERVRDLLKGTASMEFWLTYRASEVDLYSADYRVAEILKSRADSTSKSLLQALVSTEQLVRQGLLHQDLMNGSCIGFATKADKEWVDSCLVLAADELPTNFRGVWSAKPYDDPYGLFKDKTVYELVALTSTDGKAALGGEKDEKVVRDAKVEFGDSRRGGNGAPYVSMTMYPKAASTWAQITKAAMPSGTTPGKDVAIVLDGMVVSHPTVQSAIENGSSQITGNFDIQEAEDLVNVLKSGKLPAPASIIQEQVVGPSLGSASIRSGLISFLIAFCLVLLYMVFFYQGAGLIADIALLCNVLLLFGVLVSFGAVLTLPGIAGLVLTLGMAVDANVIIYERIKEELAAGKGFSLAVHDGYKNAYSAIIDGQLTTLITGIILYNFGSGPVQGFATTLIIGIITSVLTSIFITRIIFDDRIKAGKTVAMSNKLTQNILKNTKIDFIGKKKWSYILSGTLIVISIASIAFKGFSYGVDFTGGRNYIVRFDQSVTAEDVRAKVEATFEAAAKEAGVDQYSVEVKQFGSDAQMKITTQYKNKEESTEVDKEIAGLLYDALKGFYANQDIQFEEFSNSTENTNGIISSDKVGPTIAREITRGAIIAVILALLAIFAYIAVRFKGWAWGLGGVVSLAHTALIVIGFFSLFNGILPFNLDVDQTFIAAILTIIGYAINDNVVIFDRIREQKGLHPKEEFNVTVNAALNATLTRTLNTSISTLLPMLAIAIFGGESIRGLAVALCLGVVIGTYASIMIGTPVMYDLTMRRKK